MTHIEFLKNLIKEYKKDFEEEPAVSGFQKAFREGMIFAWTLAIVKLEKGEVKEND